MMICDKYKNQKQAHRFEVVEQKINSYGRGEKDRETKGICDRMDKNEKKRSLLTTSKCRSSFNKIINMVQK